MVLTVVESALEVILCCLKVPGQGVAVVEKNQRSAKHISNEGALAPTTPATNKEGMKTGFLIRYSN